MMIRTVKEFGAITYGSEKATEVSYAYPLHGLEYRPEEPGNYPVILFLHGIGERGDNVDLLEKNEIPQLFKGDFKCPYIIFAPQMPKQQSAWNRAIGEVIINYLRTYEAPSYHITGLSMGGIGTGNFLAMFPGFFSTAGIVCGTINNAAHKELLRIPARCWHGDNDNKVKPTDVINDVALLKGRGADIDLILLPGVAHNAWDRAYDPNFKDNYWNWLLTKIQVEEPVVSALVINKKIIRFITANNSYDVMIT